MAHKLGLKPHIPDERDIKLKEVYTASTSTSSNYGATGLNWGMLGNNRFGDCYWASAAHEVMAEASQAGRKPVFGEQEVLTSYAEYLGLSSYADLNERTDEGTDAREGAKFRASKGVKDIRGHGHRIGAYAFIEQPDYDLIKSAVHDFEGVTVCVELPKSAEEAFGRAEQGEGEYVWDFEAGSQIAGGHAIAGTSVRDDQLVIVTWGQEVVMTEAFVEKYLQCVVVYVSGSVLNGEGKSINGLDLSALKGKLADIS